MTNINPDKDPTISSQGINRINKFFKAEGATKSPQVAGTAQERGQKNTAAGEIVGRTISKQHAAELGTAFGDFVFDQGIINLVRKNAALQTPEVLARLEELSSGKDYAEVPSLKPEDEKLLEKLRLASSGVDYSTDVGSTDDLDAVLDSIFNEEPGQAAKRDERLKTTLKAFSPEEDTEDALDAFNKLRLQALMGDGSLEDTNRLNPYIQKARANYSKVSDN